MFLYFGDVEDDGIHVHHTLSEKPCQEDFPAHKHDYYELVYVVRGSGRYVTEGMQYTLRPGSALLVRPQEGHHLMPDPVPLERYVFQFTEDALYGERTSLLSPFYQSEMGRGNFYHDDALPLRVGYIFSQVDEIHGFPRDTGVEMIRLILSEGLHIFSLAVPTTRQNGADLIATRLERYLEANLTADLSLDELARRFYVSKFYLCRTFKEHAGVSIHAFLMKRRVKLAREMIESGESASDAAERVGFGHYSSFYRAYRKVYGTSPCVDDDAGDEEEPTA